MSQLVKNDNEESSILLLLVSEACTAWLLPGMPAALEAARRTAAAAVWSTDAQQDARTPLPSAARRTKQRRRGAAARLCFPQPEPGAPPVTDSCVGQSQAAWEERFSGESQSRGGAGEGVRGGPLMDLLWKFAHPGPRICVF